MASIDNLETSIVDTVESVIDNIASALNAELPYMDIKPFLIPTEQTIVWHAEDGSASVALHPDTTVDVVTEPKLTAPQLQNLTTALAVVNSRLGIAILARTVASSVAGSDQ